LLPDTKIPSRDAFVGVVVVPAGGVVVVVVGVVVVGVVVVPVVVVVVPVVVVVLVVPAIPAAAVPVLTYAETGQYWFVQADPFDQDDGSEESPFWPSTSVLQVPLG
jgi:hypothetical protein